MVTSPKFTLWLLLATVPCPAAQPKAFLRDLTHMQIELLRSPFKSSKRTWAQQGIPVLAATAPLIILDRSIVRSLPNSPRQRSISLGFSQVGGLYTLAAGAALPILIGKVSHHSTVSRSGLAGAQALSSAVVLTYALKYSLGRERPDRPGASRFFHGGESFPSGHSMTTFALATAIARSQGTPRWLKVTLYAAATSVALSRITAIRHHPSDAFFGSALGIWVGARSARTFAP